MSSINDEGPQARKRLYALDWLRVLAVLGVFYAHTSDIFDMFYWHLRGEEQGSGLLVLMVFGTEWGMSLFFLLAGASAWFALQSRTGGQFMKERFKRLLIPCMVGFILLSPPQAYLLAISHTLYHGSLFQFYPSFFETMQVSWDPQWLWTSGYHLWFLAYLFAISLLTLPALLYFRGARGQRLISRLAAWCERPGGLFVFILPIALIQTALRAPFPAYREWADFFTWLLIFVYGFILLAEPRFGSALEKQGKLALVVGSASLLILLAAYSTGVLNAWEHTPAYSAGYILYQLLRSITAWSWLLFVLYVGRHFLNFSNRVIAYANEAVLPFYVLHHLVIVVIAFLTFTWSISLGLKFLIVSTAALLTTLVLYDLLIRRVRLSRWLFGMKPVQSLHEERLQEAALSSTPSSPFHL